VLDLHNLAKTLDHHDRLLLNTALDLLDNLQVIDQLYRLGVRVVADLVRPFDLLRVAAQLGLGVVEALGHKVNGLVVLVLVLLQRSGFSLKCS